MRAQTNLDSLIPIAALQIGTEQLAAPIWSIVVTASTQEGNTLHALEVRVPAGTERLIPGYTCMSVAQLGEGLGCAVWSSCTHGSVAKL